MLSGRVQVGHPVDIATGVVTSSSVDVSIRGRMPLTWERAYGTPPAGSRPGPLGPGWSSRYFSTLRRTEAGHELSSGGGVVVTFLDQDDALGRGETLRSLTTFQELRARGGELVVTSWDVETFDVERLRFGRVGESEVLHLTGIERGDGAALSLTYDQDARLRAITQVRERRSLMLDYAPGDRLGRILLVLANGGQEVVVRYEYDRDGRLSAAIDALGRVARYEYDQASRLTHELALCGEEYFFAYDGRSRCVETSGPEGYDRKLLRFVDERRVTELRDSRGGLWRYHWNELGQVVMAISPRSAAEVTRYDEHGRIVETLDAYGRAITYAYDDLGNRVSVKHPNGSETTSRFDEHHRLVSTTDPLGATWDYAYGGVAWSPTEITVPTGLTWRRNVSGDGDLLTMENSEGGAWWFAYDEFGQLVAMTDWTGATCRYAHDDRGNIAELMDPEGGTTRYVYNAVGNPTWVRYPDESIRTMSYDRWGRVARVEANGLRTDYEYGPSCSTVRRESDSAGRVTEYLWGSEPGMLLGVVDPKGERHSFVYDQDGYLVEDTFPNGRIIRYVRDLCGFVTERTNGAGETTVYERDPVGRIVRAAFHDGSEARFEYDAVGLEVRAENAEGAVEIERNIAGDRVRESFGGVTVESEYDVFGQRTARRSSLGGSTRFRYDRHGRIEEVGISEGDRYARDLDGMGREVRARFGSTEILSRYDPMGRLAYRWAGQAEAGDRRPQPDRRPRSVSERRFSYDEHGNPTEISEDRWGTRAFRYDAADHVTEVLSRDEVLESYRYDANGNVIAQRRTIHRRPEEYAAERLVGPANQIQSEDGIRYEYDGDGRLIRMTDRAAPEQGGAWEFSWGPLGLLATVTSPDAEVWRYAYDAFGRRIRKSGPGVDTGYVWDGNAVMHELRDDESSPATWTFWPDNFVPIAKQVDGHTYLAVTDHLGTPRELVREDGTLVWSARFTLWGDLDELAVSDVECNLRFQGQWFDEESGLHYNGCRYYSPWMAAFISMDPLSLIGGFNGYHYAPNPLRWIDPHGLKVEPLPWTARGVRRALPERSPAATSVQQTVRRRRSTHPAGPVAATRITSSGVTCSGIRSAEAGATPGTSSP